jgi:undecaprenyl diphosphate synthase
VPELLWYESFMVNVVRCGEIPRSVAFIMDGNRRYAAKNKQQKHHGHSAGLKRLETALIWCKALGVAEVTVFALAKENLKRSQIEVDTLMNLCKDQFARLARNNGLF